MSIFYEDGKVVSEIGTGRIKIKNSSKYNIGDTIDGGRVVYTYGEPVTGFKALVAKQVSGTFPWSSAEHITGASGTAIGTGLDNTLNILSRDKGNIAAKAAFNVDGYWFLPSKDELNEIYKNKTLFGSPAGFFWSSTEATSLNAWVQRFSDGAGNNVPKSSSFLVFQVKIILG